MQGEERRELGKRGRERRVRQLPDPSERAAAASNSRELPIVLSSRARDQVPMCPFSAKEIIWYGSGEELGMKTESHASRYRMSCSCGPLYLFKSRSLVV